MASPTVLISSSRRRGAWLFIADGAQAGRDLRLGRRVTIGTDAQHCDLALQDQTVSAQHARIQREGGAFVLYDLASTNGCWVNGEQVHKCTLHDDDEIRLGMTTLIFKATPK
jgi:pSer/pThr/pTyr-binding forkhead associated (FHA) protein